MAGARIDGEQQNAGLPDVGPHQLQRDSRPIAIASGEYSISSNGTGAGPALLNPRPAPGRLSSFAGSVQALIDVGCPISRQDFGLVSPVVAFHHLDLLGSPLQRGFAIFGSNSIWIDELLGKARFAEQERCDKSERPNVPHGETPRPEKNRRSYPGHWLPD
jgi:hypothetical protein